MAFSRTGIEDVGDIDLEVREQDRVLCSEDPTVLSYVVDQDDPTLLSIWERHAAASPEVQACLEAFDVRAAIADRRSEFPTDRLYHLSGFDLSCIASSEMSQHGKWQRLASLKPFVEEVERLTAVYNKATGHNVEPGVLVFTPEYDIHVGFHRELEKAPRGSVWERDRNAVRGMAMCVRAWEHPVVNFSI